MFRGYVSGDPDSYVVLSLSPYGNSGLIRSGKLQYFVSPRRGGKQSGDGVEYAIYELGDIPVDKQTMNIKCYTKHTDNKQVLPEKTEASSESYAWRVAFVAVETDYEYWQLFGNTDAAVAYVIQLMGTVSSFYERDINVKLYLSYIRIWPNSECPFNEWDTGPALDEFKFYWRDNMDSVERDIAHMLSGKANDAGMADVDQLCDYDWGFAVSQGIRGWYPRPPVDKHPDNGDLSVVSHEIGHNFGSPHTHCYDPPIDNCGQDFDDCWNGIYECQVGTLMSYCGGCPGGLSNQLLSFHPRVVSRIRESVDTSCLRYGLDPAYVDGSNTGFEDGSISNPFNTVEEGVQFVVPGGIVIITPGFYPEQFVDDRTIHRPMKLSTSGGTVTIGP
jgi:hypothetical protein